MRSPARPARTSALAAAPIAMRKSTRKRSSRVASSWERGAERIERGQDVAVRAVDGTGDDEAVADGALQVVGAALHGLREVDGRARGDLPAGRRDEAARSGQRHDGAGLLLGERRRPALQVAALDGPRHHHHTPERLPGGTTDRRRRHGEDLAAGADDRLGGQPALHRVGDDGGSGQLCEHRQVDVVGARRRRSAGPGPTTSAGPRSGSSANPRKLEHRGAHQHPIGLRPRRRRRRVACRVGEPGQGGRQGGVLGAVQGQGQQAGGHAGAACRPPRWRRPPSWPGRRSPGAPPPRCCR